MKMAKKDKHLRLNQEKIEKVKEISGAKTETEAIEKALNLLIERDTLINKRREIVRRIIFRRERIGRIKGDVADYVVEGRRERERIYGS